ncbi:hypothetical protein NDU88_001351 [Pleurodeles waltl]|uniref:Retrotransposon gag domain-containing protein n=1 Tax=Pleurodeles waltl TaxID=8319 RepID=A0AAV7U7V8_PLEWA|nr:hypothetical protein NDU88_001351 [Pleurodeles waltl]
MFERPGLEVKEALCDIQQGNQDVLQCITRYKQLAAETTWVERTFVTLFHRGLHEGIKYELVHSTPTRSLKELMDQAMNIEYRLRERKMERRRMRVPYQPGVNRTISRRTDEVHSGASSSSTEEPMQIDLICGPLSETEKEDRRRKGLCLYCGKAGHQI